MRGMRVPDVPRLRHKVGLSCLPQGASIFADFMARFVNEPQVPCFATIRGTKDFAGKFVSYQAKVLRTNHCPPSTIGRPRVSKELICPAPFPSNPSNPGLPPLPFI